MGATCRNWKLYTGCLSSCCKTDDLLSIHLEAFYWMCQFSDLLPLPPAQAVDIELQYRVCYARILDSKRRFLEAALRCG